VFHFSTSPWILWKSWTLKHVFPLEYIYIYILNIKWLDSGRCYIKLKLRINQLEQLVIQIDMDFTCIKLATLRKIAHNSQNLPLKRGAWSPEEDQKLIAYINRHGIRNWIEMPKAAGKEQIVLIFSWISNISPKKMATVRFHCFVLRFLLGLLRSGKSCRLRWMNYLRPDIKRGNFSMEEVETILKLHGILGNR